MAFDDGKKTVSGAIAHTDDAAAKVPFVSLKCGIAPTLSGVSSVSVTQTGRNLIPFAVDYPNYTKTTNGMTISILADGKVKFNGTTTANTDFSFYNVNVPDSPRLFVKNGTYTFSNIGSASVKMIVSGGSNNGFPYREITNDSFTGNVTDETKSFNYIIFRFASGVTLSDVVIEPMLEYGSTAHAYEPYQTPTVYTVSLGRTIYGGTADVVNGEGKETWAEIDMGDLTWTYDSTYSRFISSSLPDCIKIDTARTTPILCSAYQVISDGRPLSQVPDKSIYLSFHSSGSQLTDAFVHDSDYTDATAFKTAVTGQKIVYQLKDSAQAPFTFTGQEINTRLGYNAFWSEQGNTELTYYKSGYGFTSVTIHKETPEGEPVEETRKLHRIIYEGQVDVISGTGLIYIGESGTEYDPPETFTFPTISIGTDDGENTLFANEGDSAITYRKAVD